MNHYSIMVKAGGSRTSCGRTVERNSANPMKIVNCPECREKLIKKIACEEASAKTGIDALFHLKNAQTFKNYIGA